MKIITIIKWNKFICLLATKNIINKVILFICININFLIIFHIVTSSALLYNSLSLITSFNNFIFGFLSEIVLLSSLIILIFSILSLSLSLSNKGSIKSFSFSSSFSGSSFIIFNGFFSSASNFVVSTFIKLIVISFL